jgi:hypothetical protein
MSLPQSVDLPQLGDITLAPDREADLEEESALGLQDPEEFMAGQRVYDLDEDEEVGGLTLGQIVEDSGAEEEDEVAVEYTLEIEEDLEFEVERLELEEDEEGEHEDDDDR